MKFSHSIQFNAVPDWSSHYIAYSNLKKLLVPPIHRWVTLTRNSIFQLERSVHQKSSTAVGDTESSPLLEGAIEDDSDRAFSLALDRELEKICSFYQLKELEIYGELDSVLKDEAEVEQDIEEQETSPTAARPSTSRTQRSSSVFRDFAFGKRRQTASNPSVSLRDSDSEPDEVAPLRASKSIDASRLDHNPEQSMQRASRRRSSFFEDYQDMAFSVLYDTGITVKKSLISVYVQLCELRSFIQLNRTGFSKILKKYDKILDRQLRPPYLADQVDPAYPFQEATMERLSENIASVEEVYARLVTQGQVDEAKRELRLNLREHVVWERNTVWREMIGIERRGQAAALGLQRTILGGDDEGSNVRLQGDAHEDATKEVQTPLGRYRIPSWLVSSKFYTLIALAALFALLLWLPIMKEPEQQNCLALIALVSSLWATEVSYWLDLRSRADFEGNSSLRYISARAFFRSCAPSCPNRRGATTSSGCQGCRRVCCFVNVESSDNAIARRFYHRSSAVQVQYCQEDGDLCPEQGWHHSPDGPSYYHVRGDLCEYVDQQCGRAGALLFHHSGMRLSKSKSVLTVLAYSPEPAFGLEHVQGTDNGDCPCF